MSSVASRMYFCPDKISRVEPAGMSTPVRILRADVPLSRNCTSTEIVPVVMLHKETAKTTVVVAAGAAYTVEYPVPICVKCAFLNVFAMSYPSAIASAVASSTVERAALLMVTGLLKSTPLELTVT